jgi:putative membrane protein
LTTTLGVLLAAGIVNGVRADTIVALLAASLLLGILNAFLRPVLMLFALPLLLLTLGLFTFVINALLLYFVAHLVKGFYVADFWAAFKGALVISIVSFFVNSLTGTKEIRTEPPRTVTPPRASRPKPPPDTGSGPIIDV